MRTTRIIGASLLVVLTACGVRAQEVEWHSPPAGPAAAAASSEPAVTLRRPIAVEPAETSPVQPAVYDTPANLPAMRALVLTQAPGGAVPAVPPPPPPPPPGAGAAVPPVSEEGYNCGVATTPPPSSQSIWDSGKGFFTGICDCVHSWFVPTDGHKPFMSDHCFDDFVSPLTNPFYFEDPRSLTEVKLLYMLQGVPTGNPGFGGGYVNVAGLQARVALTDRLSIVMQELGWIWADVRTPNAYFQTHSGLTQIAIGPKYTFIRNEASGSLLAGGLTFEIPAGSANVYQDTGTLGLRPYLSYGQRFGASSYGKFHFLNTTGYDFAVDNVRSEFLFSSFHLDYDIASTGIAPLVELNYLVYTRSGSNVPYTFDGQDLFNFGSNAVAGKNTLNLAVGARYKPCETVQFGAGVQFPVLDPKMLDEWRLTFDVIFRY